MNKKVESNWIGNRKQYENYNGYNRAHVGEMTLFSMGLWCGNGACNNHDVGRGAYGVDIDVRSVYNQDLI